MLCDTCHGDSSVYEPITDSDTLCPDCIDGESDACSECEGRAFVVHGHEASDAIEHECPACDGTGRELPKAWTVAA